MLANRLPLLLAFAAGSLGTALVGFSHGETETAPPPRPPHVVEQTFVPPDPPAAATNHERRHALPEESQDTDAAPANVDTPDAGNSIAEVLMRLEASYRQALAEPKAERLPAAVETPPPAAAPAIPSSAPAPPATIAIASAPPPAITTTPPRPDVPASAASPAATDSVHVARAPSHTRSSDVHVGDVHQNIYLGNVHQGDVLQMQQLQLQQLAILQYLQLLALSPQGSSTYPGRAQAPGRAPARRPRPFAMGLTNPDNPWGFDFPPTVLVK